MTGIVGTWQRRSAPQRVDLYTRWTLYVVLAAGPFVALSLVVAVPPPAGVAYVTVVTAQTAAAVGLVRSALVHLLDGEPVSRRWLVALAAATVAATGTGLAVLPAATGSDTPARSAGLMVTLTVAVLAVSPLLGARALLLPAAGVAAAVTLSETAAGSAGAPVVGGLFGLVAWSMAVSFRLSGWMLGVVWEQDRSRAVHARLAVAEERLRFSRDLHDVVGRTLSAVALKSELAAELARRGQGGAVEQMLEVRELAQDSLREVRGVVTGLRTADLTAELTGARSVLRSAGIETRVVGDGAGVPDDVQQALAWVVREAVTNVVRHAHARRCTIVLDRDATGALALTITNDGVVERDPGATGSGLLGLCERLAQVGGELTTSREEDRFTLRATVAAGATGGAGAMGAAGPVRAAGAMGAAGAGSRPTAQDAASLDGTVGR